MWQVVLSYILPVAVLRHTDNITLREEIEKFHEKQRVMNCYVIFNLLTELIILEKCAEE